MNKIIAVYMLVLLAFGAAAQKKICSSYIFIDFVGASDNYIYPLCIHKNKSCKHTDLSKQVVIHTEVDEKSFHLMSQILHQNSLDRDIFDFHNLDFAPFSYTLSENSKIEFKYFINGLKKERKILKELKSGISGLPENMEAIKWLDFFASQLERTLRIYKN